MIGEFNRGTKFTSKETVTIFETIPLHESEVGLYIEPSQVWEIDGYDPTAEIYILVCKETGVALRVTIENLRGLFQEITRTET